MCSLKCAGVLSSERMKKNNPMKNKETRDKVSRTLKKIGHKPPIRGGNGTGMTEPQRILLNELNKQDESFRDEVVVKTMPYTHEFKSPYGYKVDIGSRKHKLAIEVDGSSHNTLKRIKCDKKKTEVLNLKGWRVLRFTNQQIMKSKMDCVQKVLSMI